MNEHSQHLMQAHEISRINSNGACMIFYVEHMTEMSSFIIPKEESKMRMPKNVNTVYLLNLSFIRQPIKILADKVFDVDEREEVKYETEYK